MSKILVIEDEEPVRENIVELLSEEGYDMVGTSNGDEGIRLAWRELPDLIICDIMLPGLDGYEVLARLSQDTRLSSIPFLFLTARISRDDMRRGMSLGADDYITKPFTRRELLQAITTRINRMQKLEKFAQRKLDDLRKNITNRLPHEILTPLSVTMGLSELLDTQVDVLSHEEIRKAARDIHRSTERLMHLVQNYLLFSELETAFKDPQKMEPYLSLDGAEAMPAISSLCAEKARQVGRETDLEMQLQPARLQIYDFHLAKIVEELMDHALLFSPGGSRVHVGGKILPESGRYRLQVDDQGRGMNPEQVRAIDGFVQFNRQLPEMSDMGLGLFLVKRLCSLYQGEFRVSSQPGQGTTIQVELPIRVQPA